MKNDKPRIAVVGAGYWGKNLVRNYAELESLAAVCDSNAKALAPFADSYPGAECVTSFQDLVKRKDIDAVAIAAPAEAHLLHPLTRMGPCSGGSNSTRCLAPALAALLAPSTRTEAFPLRATARSTAKPEP